MKFQFCGGLNVPDWLLKEIGTLQRLGTDDVKTVAQQIVDNLVTRRSFDGEVMGDICKRGRLTESDMRAIVTTLRFVICSSAQYDVDSALLKQEELEIGMDVEIAEVISEVYATHKEKIQGVLKQLTLRLPHLSTVHPLTYTLVTKDEITNQSVEPYVVLHLVSTTTNDVNASEAFDLILRRDQIEELIVEFQSAIRVMKQGLEDAK